MFTKADNVLVWEHITQARSEIHTYISSLEAAQWNHETLCSGWRVRDVVSHLILLYQYSAGDWASGLIRSKLSINKFMSDTAVQMGNKDRADLLERFRKVIDIQKVPTIVPPLNALVDALIHEQDMRIALGHPRNMPLESLQLIFEHWRPGRYNLGERITAIHKRTSGLQFVADDIGMRYGEGLEVVGRAQDILLIIAGRKAVLGNLSGEGMDILTRRLA